MSKQPPLEPTASATDPCPTIIQISKLVGRFGSEYFPSTIVPLDHPLTNVLRRFSPSHCEIIGSLDSL